MARLNGQFELATRFIALASVGNAAKNKFIYALNVTAVDKMRLTDLIQKTTNEIPCPYDSMTFSIGAIKSAKAAEGNQFFYDMNTTDDHQHRRRGKFNNQSGQGYQQKRPRQLNFDQGNEDDSFSSLFLWDNQFSFSLSSEKCWFCLSSPDVEKHLVITIGDSFYLALAKGPINQYHVLILSVTHIQSVALLSEEDFNELEKFKSALKEFFASKSFNNQATIQVMSTHTISM